MVHCKEARLLDYDSEINREVAKIFSVLEPRDNIQIALIENLRVEVFLPRFHLRFVLNEGGHLASKQLNLEVDPDQSIGTLIGLENKLILRGTNSKLDKTRRQVLISFGETESHRQKVGHRVRIKIPEEQSCEYFCYKINQYLQKVEGPLDARSELYMILLHAQTSSDLNDPLTERSGTEEALSRLRAASLFSCISCRPEDPECASMLAQIASLTPHHEGYPVAEFRGHTVTWRKDLSPLAQHEGFHKGVAQIREHAQRFSQFFPAEKVIQFSIDRGDLGLLARAAKRNAGYRRAEFGGLELSSADDKPYRARDRVVVTERSVLVTGIASLVKKRPPKFPVITDLKQLFDSWHRVSGFNKPFGQSIFNEMLSLQFPDHWGALYDVYRRRIVHTLLAFHFCDSFTHLDPPQGNGLDFYEFEDGWKPEVEKINPHIDAARVYPPMKPDEKISRNKQKTKKWEKENAQAIRDEANAYNKERAKLVQEILAQWPSKGLTVPSSVRVPLIRKDEAVKNCDNLWQKWDKNEQLSLHLNEAQKKLEAVNGPYTPQISEKRGIDHQQSESLAACTPVYTVPDLDDFLGMIDARSVPINDPDPPAANFPCRVNRSRKDYSELKEILNLFHVDPGLTRSNYGATHLESLRALKLQDNTRTLPPDHREHNVTYYQMRQEFKRSEILDLLQNFRQALDRVDVVCAQWKILQQANLSPCTSIPSFLKRIAAGNDADIGEGWKENLLALAEAIADMQRWQRSEHLYEAGDLKKWQLEIQNFGRSNWNTDEHPDWILFEIENDLTIRDSQTKMAFDVGYPASGSNSVFQLSMGGGKTSVIVVLLAVALAAKDRLVRIVVLKPLLTQTLQHLQKCLGGLMNRKVYYMPFSRSTLTSMETAVCLHPLYEEAMATGGIVVTLPKEISTLKLMGQERLSSDITCATQLLKTEHWLQLHSRSILDESDEILSPKHQVNFTIGSQQVIDGAPYRWKIAPAVLRRVKIHAQELHCNFPDLVEVQWSERAFPTIHFSERQPSEALLDRLVDDAITGKIEYVHLDGRAGDALEQIAQFMRHKSCEDGERIAQLCADTRLYQCVKIIRGLVAFGNLIHALQKRHTVEYGRSSGRSLKAVPFRAKGVPAERSEFAHPDLTILLTCLAHLKGGLHEEDIHECIQTLEKEPGASLEYIKWTEDSKELQKSYPYLSCINIADDDCRQLLFHGIKNNYASIDFFLDRIVFPKICQYYTKKLCASSWDIPSRVKNPRCVTTGFSGTNDNRYTLPYNIEQRDLDIIKPTNAVILSELLSPENREYRQMVDGTGKKMNASELLRHLTDHIQNFKVLVDVGAQILDLSNLEVAREMLHSSRDAEAAIFFNDRDEPTVVDGRGYLTPLRLSSFKDSLANCLVYFDEAHTRWIDLAIPDGARAAVTLGPRLEKDRLVQGCKRMRRLGSGHSVVFFAPPEVHREVFRTSKKLPTQQLDSRDVLLWSMTNTCAYLERAQHLCLMQGLRHVEKQAICDEFQNTSHNGISGALNLPIDAETAAKLSKQLEEDEIIDLEQLYGVHQDRTSALIASIDGNSADSITERLRADYGRLHTNDLVEDALEEEQERQVLQEVEEEVRVEDPVYYEPQQSYISSGLTEFIHTGTISELPGTVPVSEALTRTSAAGYQSAIKHGFEGLYVTYDYLHNVRLPERMPLDDFMPVVNWMLINDKTPQDVLIISPHEANEELEEIRKSPYVRLCIYAPKTTTSMTSFSELNFYSPTKQRFPVKAKPSTSLKVDTFAGALWFDDYRSCTAACHYLGLILAEDCESLDETKRTLVSPGCFVEPKVRSLLGWPCECPFTEDPLPFVGRMIAMRHKKQDVSSTHMGMLVGGKRLSRELIEGNKKAIQKNHASLLPGRRYASEAYRNGEDIENGPPSKRVCFSAPANVGSDLRNLASSLDTGTVDDLDGNSLFLSAAQGERLNQGNTDLHEASEAVQACKSEGDLEMKDWKEVETADVIMRDVENRHEVEPSSES
ncbi:MAG: hypothetical protein Q9157_005685 [Trypethelium eluteriae]